MLSVNFVFILKIEPLDLESPFDVPTSSKTLYDSFDSVQMVHQEEILGFF